MPELWTETLISTSNNQPAGDDAPVLPALENRLCAGLTVGLDGALLQVIRSSPKSCAIAWTDGQLSYAQLGFAIQRIQRALTESGVQPGTLVALEATRRPETIVLMLAVLSCGAAYLPIAQGLPRAYRARILQDANPDFIVRGMPDLQGTDTVGAWIDPGHVDTVHAACRESPTVEASGFTCNGTAESLAYVMYTSGSTGVPKGVEVMHRGVLRLVLRAGYAAFGPDTVMLQAAPLGFDASTLEIFAPLLNGGRCVIFEEDQVATGPDLANCIAQHGINTAWLGSALFNTIVDDTPEYLNGLKQLLIGGEALSPEHIRRFQSHCRQTTLINGYGPTECTTFTCTYRIPALDPEVQSVPIGRPINDTSLWILNEDGRPVPTGKTGELWVGGAGVARGYRNQPELTESRFRDNVPGTGAGRLFRTGDLVYLGQDGNLWFVGRADDQVKISGHRVEPAEVSGLIESQPMVRQCAVIALPSDAGNRRLVACVVLDNAASSLRTLKAAAREFLPGYMYPSEWVELNALPINDNGKLDRQALTRQVTGQLNETPSRVTGDTCKPLPPDAGVGPLTPGTVEQQVHQVFRELAGYQGLAVDENFFEAGINSLSVVRALGQLRRAGFQASVGDVYQNPTVRGLSQLLTRQSEPAAGGPVRVADEPDDGVAIIGMAIRVPGADSPDAFWSLLAEGKDAVTRFSADELDSSLSALWQDNPDYVPVRGVIADVDRFDASFFGMSPREADFTDPQHRIFLQLCWHCLEDGAMTGRRSQETIGVFAGMYNSSYWQNNVIADPQRLQNFGEFNAMLANEKDYLATTVAHKLDLNGPAISVQTACSTSLVAVVQAMQAVLSGQCTAALAGGVSITCPVAQGHVYQPGAIQSKDGKTRTFDRQATGTVFSDGAGVVLLKRLSDAMRDGDRIHGVIRGGAVNNDGRSKASFTAPTSRGQAEVIRLAHRNARVSPREVSYVEAHGTATPLGDPIEIQGLHEAFATAGEYQCHVGSVKSNIGHCVTAAGVAGLIKTVLALKHELIPSSIHVSEINPELNLEQTGLSVVTRAVPWPRTQKPRIAGVSAFGIGGTNAHVVLEEAPATPVTTAQRQPNSQAVALLPVSAHSENALRARVRQLAQWLDAHPAIDADAVAMELVRRGEPLAFRYPLIVDRSKPAGQWGADAMDNQAASQGLASVVLEQVVLVFPGQGGQYARMGMGLYNSCPVFRAEFDDVVSQMTPHLDFDITQKLRALDAAELTPTRVQQPLLFCIEYALGRRYLAAINKPVVLVGHSVGEYAAAALAGLIPLSDACRLVAERGRLMQQMPAGSMLAIGQPYRTVEKFLPDATWLATQNAADTCVIGGTERGVDQLMQLAAERKWQHKRLATSHAFHTPLMADAQQQYQRVLNGVTFAHPRLPVFSTMTGGNGGDVMQTPEYWAEQIVAPVRFYDAITSAIQHPNTAVVELGPGGQLTAVLSGQEMPAGNVHFFPVMGGRVDQEIEKHLELTGQLWRFGVLDIDAPGGEAPDGAERVFDLPPYPFQRDRHWLDPVADPDAASVENLDQRGIATLITGRAEETDILNKPLRSTDSESEIAAIITEVTGVDIPASSYAETLVSMGIESLAVTQIAQRLKKVYGLPLSFKDIMTDCNSISKIAMRIAGSPQCGCTPTQPQPAPMALSEDRMRDLRDQKVAQETNSTPQAGQAGAVDSPGRTVVTSLIERQLDLMAQQLELLRQPVAPRAASVTAASIEPAAPVSTTAAEQAASPPKSAAGSAPGAGMQVTRERAALSNQQQHYVQDFIDRYVRRTLKSKEYAEQNRGIMADPRVATGFNPVTKEICYPIVVERSDGANLWDIDGNQYVDALNGFGMNLFGWRPEFVNAALKDAIDTGYEIGPQHPLAAKVCGLIGELTGNERTALCNTGSEAVLGAIRIARTVTGRNQIVIFEGAYHGIFDESLVRRGGSGKTQPNAAGILDDAVGNVQVLRFDAPESLEYIRGHADHIAAVLVEPVQSRNPSLQARQFLVDLRGVTQAAQVALIFDEIVTGFRSHTGGIQSLFGIRADICTYGKVIGGGLPIGAISGKAQFLDALDGGQWQFGDDSMPLVGVTYFAGTFVRHPLALASANAVLEHLKSSGDSLQASLNRKTQHFCQRLNHVARELGVEVTVASFSSIWKIQVADPAYQGLLFALMRHAGVHILENFPCFFTTAHTQEHFERIEHGFREALIALRYNQFLPAKPSRPGAVFDANFLPLSSNQPVSGQDNSRLRGSDPARTSPLESD